MSAPIRIDLTALPRITNAVYYPLFGDRSRYLVLRGGAGSGKSVFVADHICIRLMREAGHNWCAFRKVAVTSRTSIFAQFGESISRLGVTSLWKKNRTELTWTFVPNGSVFRCLGMDDPEKLKSIVGMSGAWLEEATEFLPADLEQINLRLRGKTPGRKQIILSFNPVSARHWLKARFYDTPTPNARLVHTTYRDNRFLDTEYEAQLNELCDRDPIMAAIYRDGLWGQLKGAIYAPFLDGPWPETFEDTSYGLDFGFNHPTALIRSDYRDGAVYLTEELYVRGKTTAEVIAIMEKRGISRKAPIYADAAEPDRIKEISLAGYNIHAAYKGPNSVKAGIDFVKSLKVYTKAGNENLNAENALYAWAVDREGNAMDEPVKAFDDAMDAMRYGIFTHLKHRPGGKIEGGALGGVGVF